MDYSLELTITNKCRVESIGDMLFDISLGVEDMLGDWTGVARERKAEKQMRLYQKRL